MEQVGKIRPSIGLRITRNSLLESLLYLLERVVGIAKEIAIRCRLETLSASSKLYNHLKPLTSYGATVYTCLVQTLH